MFYPAADRVRWTVASEYNGPTRAEAKAQGMTLKREGRMRRYYRDGKLVMAYSYNTCIMARDKPSEDYPEGRVVLNLTTYGMTSTRHLNAVMNELAGWDWMAVWRHTDGTRHLRGIREVYGVEVGRDESYLLSERAVMDSAEAIIFDHQMDLERRTARRLAQAQVRAGDKLAMQRASFKLFVVK